MTTKPKYKFLRSGLKSESGNDMKNNLRTKIQHKTTGERYTLGDSQVDYILACVRKEVLRCLPKKVPTMGNPDPMSRTQALWHAQQGYNLALTDMRSVIKEKLL